MFYCWIALFIVHITVHITTVVLSMFMNIDKRLTINDN